MFLSSFPEVPPIHTGIKPSVADIYCLLLNNFSLRVWKSLVSSFHSLFNSYPASHYREIHFLVIQLEMRLILVRKQTSWNSLPAVYTIYKATLHKILLRGVFSECRGPIPFYDSCQLCLTHYYNDVLWYITAAELSLNGHFKGATRSFVLYLHKNAGPHQRQMKKKKKRMKTRQRYPDLKFLV